jgi:hypothetical protein
MWIEIDDDLAETIEQQMRLDESREEVVRRLLRRALEGLAPAADPPGSARKGRTRTVKQGSMADLVRAGLIAPEDLLQYQQVRLGVVHNAHVDEEGRIHTSKGVESLPSTALRDLVGFSINGWSSWVHLPSGKTLSALRDELP